MSETTWVRYRRKDNLRFVGGKLVTVECEVETGILKEPSKGPRRVPLQRTIKTEDGWHRGCFIRVRTIRNHGYEEKGRHIPAYTFMPAAFFSQLYEPA